MSLPTPPLPDSLSLAAFLLLALALLAESLRLRWPSRLAALSSAGIAVACGLVQPLGAAALLAALAVSLAASRYRRPELWLVWIALLLALALHALPGFDNPLLWQGLSTPNSAPYRLYWSYDKGAAGWLLLMVLAASPQVERRWGPAAAGVGALLLLIVLGLASVAGVIAWAPKWPYWLLPWLFANFFLVSLAEEAFFRAGLQRWLELRTEPFAALMAASVAFGLVHVAGGWVWVGLATLAGLGYGLVYAATRQVLWAVLAHVAFNAVHLILFTYPRLM